MPVCRLVHVVASELFPLLGDAMRDDFVDDVDGEEFQPWMAVAAIAFVAIFWIVVFAIIRWLIL